MASSRRMTSIESLLAGRRFGESQESLKKWMKSRKTGA